RSRSSISSYNQLTGAVSANKPQQIVLDTDAFSGAEQHFVKSDVTWDKSALFGHFRLWLGDVLAVDLEPTVDVSCARYEYSEQIQEEFENNSEIQLKDFLKMLPSSLCGHFASVCERLLGAAALGIHLLLLSNFTGLRLHYLCPADDEDDNGEKKEIDEAGEASRIFQ
ncbi:unnamed protein product, partial [Lampetra planeri]